MDKKVNIYPVFEKWSNHITNYSFGFTGACEHPPPPITFIFECLMPWVFSVCFFTKYSTIKYILNRKLTSQKGPCDKSEKGSSFA